MYDQEAAKMKAISRVMTELEQDFTADLSRCESVMRQHDPEFTFSEEWIQRVKATFEQEAARRVNDALFSLAVKEALRKLAHE